MLIRIKKYYIRRASSVSEVGVNIREIILVDKDSKQDSIC